MQYRASSSRFPLSWWLLCFMLLSYYQANYNADDKRNCLCSTVTLCTCGIMIIKWHLQEDVMEWFLCVIVDFSWRQPQQPCEVLKLHHFYSYETEQRCGFKEKHILHKKMNKKLQTPFSHMGVFPSESLKDRLHHWGYLSNPHQLSSTSQASALARKKEENMFP